MEPITYNDLSMLFCNSLWWLFIVILPWLLFFYTFHKNSILIHQRLLIIYEFNRLAKLANGTPIFLSINRMRGHPPDFDLTNIFGSDPTSEAGTAKCVYWLKHSSDTKALRELCRKTYNERVTRPPRTTFIKSYNKGN